MPVGFSFLIHVVVNVYFICMNVHFNYLMNKQTNKYKYTYNNLLLETVRSTPQLPSFQRQLELTYFCVVIANIFLPLLILVDLAVS